MPRPPSDRSVLRSDRPVPWPVPHFVSELHPARRRAAGRTRTPASATPAQRAPRFTWSHHLLTFVSVPRASPVALVGCVCQRFRTFYKRTERTRGVRAEAPAGPSRGLVFRLIVLVQLLSRDELRAAHRAAKVSPRRHRARQRVFGTRPLCRGCHLGPSYAGSLPSRILSMRTALRCGSVLQRTIRVRGEPRLARGARAPPAGPARLDGSRTAHSRSVSVSRARLGRRRLLSRAARHDRARAARRVPLALGRVAGGGIR